MDWRPHDLLWIHRRWLQVMPGSSTTQQQIPAWVLNGFGPVVVRRAVAVQPGLIAVGVRGRNKSQRYAAFVPLDVVLNGITPFELVAKRRWIQHPLLNCHPVLISLQRVASWFDRQELRWGITGSLGYELASRETVLHDHSDLDLLVDLPEPLSRRKAKRWLQTLADQPCRIDIQLETPNGAVGLQEWASDNPIVLLKTQTGPYLTSTPWNMVLHKGEEGLC